MSSYAIIDVAHMFYRARHVVQGDAYTKAGMALDIMFRSLRKVHREQKVDHMVLCVEGRSWRFDVYPQYKAKRRLERMSATPAEQEEDNAFNEVLNDFVEFMKTKTRCTVLQSNKVEGDDFVARWIQLHPKDNHVIISGDSDYLQLLDHNVKIYNGVDDRLITINGVFNSDGEHLYFKIDSSSGKVKVSGTVAEMRRKHDKDQRDKEKKHNAIERDRKKLFETSEKTKAVLDPTYEPRHFVASQYDWEEFTFEIEPEWWRKALFVKLVRGDTGDGIFSSYPGVRYNGTKKTVGICEAWADRSAKGFDWNNFMLQKWSKMVGTDSNGNPISESVRVLDEYKFNESLIDLTKQPEEVKAIMDAVIVEAVQKEPVGNIGIHFMRFCAKHDLPRLSREASDYASFLNAPYARD